MVAIVTVVFGALLAGLIAPAGATGGGGHPRPPSPGKLSTPQLVQQAQPGECWIGVGQPIIRPIPRTGCPRGTKPRVTSSYVWGGKVASDGNLWYGTWDNALCANLSAYFAPFNALGVDFPIPFETSEVACEFGEALDPPFEDPVFGDSRVPRVYRYTASTNKLIDFTPTPAVDPLFNEIGGIRAFGEVNNVSIAAGLEASSGGTGQGSGGAVHLIAFNATTGKFLGHQLYPQWNNAHYFLAHNGALYFGAGAAPNDLPCSCNGPTNGQIAKWTPTVANPLPDPATVVTVANLGQGVQDIQMTSSNRMIVSTALSGEGTNSALYLSPPLRAGHLHPDDSTRFTRVLGTEQFFPDPLTAQQALGVATAEYNGDVYWTMSMYPGQSTLSHIAAYRGSFPNTLADLATWFVNAEPAAQIFRIKNIGTRSQKIELLYGEKNLRAYDPGRRGWVTRPNKLGLTPLYGGGGFNNPRNPYGGWGMAVFNGQLFMGGFDTSKILRDVLFDPASGWVKAILGRDYPPALLRAVGRVIAPDLRAAGPVWYFSDSRSPAKPLTTTGFNNQDNWGVRGLFVVDDRTMLMGTNNGFNFPASGATSPPRRPGWQLWKVTASGGHR